MPADRGSSQERHSRALKTLTRRELSGSERGRGEVVTVAAEVLDGDVDGAAVRAHGDRPASLSAAGHLRPALAAGGDIRGNGESLHRHWPQPTRRPEDAIAILRLSKRYWGLGPHQPWPATTSS
jgi:hypothetical protein